ncbi:MAG: YihY/virulence factor BrkB family protein [Acidobacteriota bacterium]|nr:YihY/virulence factor BrkB family protein [Acidobacteriota bacterium]
MLQAIKELREKLKTSWQRLDDFFNYDLWHKLPPITSRQGIVYRLLRFYHLIAKGFREDEIRLHAISLTYNTLIALIPLLALTLAFLKGFGYDAQLETFVLGYFEGYPDEFQQFINQVLDEIKQANFARIGGVGAAILLLVLIQVLNRTEATFNTIWGIEQSRSWLRNAGNYVLITIVVPILIALAVALKARVSFGEEVFSRFNFLLPFMVTWVALSFLYFAMPNTRVKPWAAAVSGLVAAILWNLLLNVYLIGQPAINRYNVIYGSLAMLPIFLIWLFISWTIVLLGARITFAVQNSQSYQPAHTGRKANTRTRLLVSLAVLDHGARALAGKEERFQAEVFSQRYAVPMPLVTRVLALLNEAGLIAETSEENVWLLTSSPENIELCHVVNLVLEEGDNSDRLGLEPFMPRVEETLAACQKRWQTQEGSLADLLKEPN